ncbi:hemagglutinin repeat-containing protein, partial [Microvirga sp. W0021]
MKMTLAKVCINIQAGVISSPGDISLTAGHDINATVAYDTVASSSKHEEQFIGVSAKVSQNVTSIISDMKRASEIFNSGHGGGAYEAIGQVSGVMKAADALWAASGGPRVSGSIMVGASRSISSQHEEMALAHGTTINAGGNLSLNAGNDIHLQGANVHAGNDLSLVAGNDITIESAQSYSSSGSREEEWNA